MLNHGVALEHFFEVIERLAPADHEVLADDFEEVHARTLGENVGVVGDAQADADAQLGALGANEQSS